MCSCFGSTGEASNVDEYLWLMGRAQYKPIMEYCGGTEIGGGFVSGSFLQPQSLAAFSTPAMGCSLFLIGNDGNPLVSTIQLNYLHQECCTYHICTLYAFFMTSTFSIIPLFFSNYCFPCLMFVQ